MEENDKLKKMTLKELQIEQKKFKNIAVSFGTVFLLMLITAIYFAIKNDSYKMFLFIGGFSGVFYLVAQKLKQIETEIKSRNS